MSVPTRKTIKLNGRDNSVVYDSLNLTDVFTFAGNDSITIRDLSDSSVNLGQGDDSLKLTSFSGMSSVNGNTGKDTLDLSAYQQTDLSVTPDDDSASTGSSMSFAFMRFLSSGDFARLSVKNFEKILFAKGIVANISTTFEVVGTQNKDVVWLSPDAPLPMKIRTGAGDDLIQTALRAGVNGSSAAKMPVHSIAAGGGIDTVQFFEPRSAVSFSMTNVDVWMISDRSNNNYIELRGVELIRFGDGMTMGLNYSTSNNDIFYPMHGQTIDTRRGNDTIIFDSQYYKIATADVTIKSFSSNDKLFVDEQLIDTKTFGLRRSAAGTLDGNYQMTLPSNTVLTLHFQPN